MDHYTPRISKGYQAGLVSNAERYTDPIGTVNFTAPVTPNAYVPVEWTYTDKLSGEETTSYVIPEVSQLALVGRLSHSGFARDQWDECAELIVVPRRSNAFVFEGNSHHRVAAWLWGDGFDALDEFPSNVDEHILTVSGPRSTYIVYARSGMWASTPAGVETEISLRAYLSDYNQAPSDYINPKCTVPPFKGTQYFLSRSSGEPAIQTAQSPRTFFSKQIVTASGSIGEANILGGPWIGNCTGVLSGAGACTVTAYGEDGGQVQLDSGSGRAEIASPATYVHQSFTIVPDGDPDTINWRIGLRSRD